MIGLPLRLSCFLGDALSYSGCIKTALRANMVYYVLLIAFDVIVVWKRMGVFALLLGTGTAAVAYDAAVLLFSDLLAQPDDFSRSNIKCVVSAGFHTMCGGFVGGLARNVMSLFASCLPTEQFAVYIVCDSVFSSSCNAVMDGWHQFVLNSVKKLDRVEGMVQQMRRLNRKYCL